jgi:hypothetical protein
MTPGDRVARANRAREILDENTLSSAFSAVRSALVDRLEATAIGDTSTQHEIALTLQCLKQVKQHLESYITDGKLAEREVEQERFLTRMRKRIA